MSLISTIHATTPLSMMAIGLLAGSVYATCSSADFAEPFGELNFFDTSAFLAVYGAGCP